MVDLAAFETAIRTRQRRMRLAGLVPLLMAPLPLLLPSPTDTFGRLTLYSVIGLCLFMAVLFLREGTRSVAAHPALLALRTPGEVTWLFLERHRSAGSRSAGRPHLKVGVISGECLQLQLIAGREDEMLEHARAAAPRATVGWSPELELAYHRSPASLLRAAAEDI